MKNKLTLPTSPKAQLPMVFFSRVINAERSVLSFVILSREWEGGSSSNIYDGKAFMVNHFARKLTFTMKDLHEKWIEGQIQNNSIEQFVSY